MKNLQLVAPGSEQPQKVSAVTMPAHFTAKQKAAWSDLFDNCEESVRVKENRFTFEMASVLMAKFRSGKPMNATETKELKKLLVDLGLAKDSDGDGKKSKNAAKYFSA